MQSFKDGNNSAWHSRMEITQLGRRLIKVQIILGTHVGDKIYIPRIIISLTESACRFLIKRRKFHISVYFAMTIIKIQGQSLNKVGPYAYIYLNKFSHMDSYA
jgi:ATP-dependent DNA helicase PIF1